MGSAFNDPYLTGATSNGTQEIKRCLWIIRSLGRLDFQTLKTPMPMAWLSGKKSIFVESGQLLVCPVIIFIGYRLNMAKYARPRSLSGTADRACEVCFRSKTEGGRISPYSVYNLFITYFTTEFTFCKLSYCNLKYLKCSALSGIWLIRLEKIAEKFCWIKTTSKHCGKTMSKYWHQKTSYHATN